MGDETDGNADGRATDAEARGHDSDVRATLVDDGEARALDSPAPASASASATPVEAAGADIDEVMRGEERDRARVFFRSFRWMALVMSVFVPFLPGGTGLRALAAAGLAGGVLVCTFALAVLRRTGAYADRLVAAVGVVCALTGVVVIYYVGIFSAGAMVLAIGVYFFAGSQSRLAARLTYATVAVLYFVASAGLAAGLLPDTGLFPAAGAAPLTRWFQVFMSQVILAVTFYLASSNRRILERAIERVTAAGRQIRQRDAQLAEARHELDRALRPANGRRSGEVLGPYVLGALLGRGGMGEVYAASHRDSDKRVAVKVLHPHLLESEQHKKLFLREAEMAASVYSRHVVHMLELGETADGAPYLVMELLDGHDLAWHLRKNGRLELPAVVDLVDQIRHALIVMRDADVVHRDLKPGNLFLAATEPPTWKVLDFGLSKALGTSSSLTQDQLLGTPAYMAPEQLRGDVSHATDLYAVAAITYRALTGATPFDGEDLARVVFKVAYDQPPDPAKYVRLPSDVELVLAIGMAKTAADRFGTIEAFSGALRAASTGDLDDVTRRRGWRLLRQTPWGSTRPRESVGERPAGRVATAR